MRVLSFFVHFCIFFVSVLNSFLFDVGWGVWIRYKYVYVIKSDDFQDFSSVFLFMFKVVHCGRSENHRTISA